MIKSVYIQDFKSFYGEHELTFDGDFNCIIGPNGSGKSNFIDAIQFVFGKRAQSMRCKEVSQLISNSRQECQVEVRFREFTIRRTANLVSSTYYFNNKEVKLKELKEHLESHGIDTKKFIILQGEVESISLMKPKTGSKEQPGLLEYIEKDFRQRDDSKVLEAQGKCFMSQEKVKIAKNTITDISSMVSLVPIVQRALHIQANQIIQSIFFFEIRIREERLVTIDAGIQKICSEQQELNTLLEMYIEEFTKSKALREQCEQEIARLQNEYSKLEDRIQELSLKYNQDEFLNCQLQINKIEVTISQTKEELTNLQQENSRLSLGPKAAKAAQLLNSKTLAEDSYRKMKNQISVESKYLYAKKQDLVRKLQPTYDSIAQLENKLAELNKEAERTSHGTAQYMNQLIEYTQKEQQLKEQDIIIERDLKKHQEVIGLIEAAKQQTIQAIEGAKQTQRETINKINDITSRIESSKIESTRESYKLNVIRRLLKVKEELNICGRLGDLGSIASKYDQAITIACPALDSIVVPTTDDALRCVQYLKDNQIGKCQFFPLDCQPTYGINRPFTPVPQCLRLFDLITVAQEKYRVVFYNVLRDTLVCDDLDVATVVAKSNRNRIVTLDGKLIDNSGVMSQRGQDVKGGMASRIIEHISDKELQELQNQKTKLKDDVQIYVQNQLLYEKKLKEILIDEEKTKSRYKVRIVDQNMLLDQFRENADQIEITNKLLTQAHKNQELHEEVIREIQITEGQIKKLQLSISEDQLDLEDLEKQIIEIANQDITAARDLFYKLTEDYEHAEQESQRLIALNNIQQKRIIACESIIKEEIHKMEQSKTRIQELYQMRALVEQQTADLKLKQQLNQEEQKKFQAELSSEEIHFKKTQNSIRELKQTTDELEAEKNDLNLKRNIERKQQSEYKIRLDQLKLNYYEIVNYFEEKDRELNFLFEVRELDQVFEDLLKKIPLNLQTAFPSRFQTELSIADLTADSIPQLQEVSHIFSNANPELNIIRLYLEKIVEYDQRLAEHKTIQNNYLTLKEEYDREYLLRRKVFEDKFEKIRAKLKEIYHTLSEGEAELQLIDPLDPFSEGIQFNVKPVNKTWKTISKLSGGEKTLASLSLILALHFYDQKQNSVYIFDEIDAALDFRNVSIVADYLQAMKCQFIIVSLRQGMFEKATRITGLFIRDQELATNVIQINLQ